MVCRFAYGRGEGGRGGKRGFELPVVVSSRQPCQEGIYHLPSMIIIRSASILLHPFSPSSSSSSFSSPFFPESPSFSFSRACSSGSAPSQSSRNASVNHTVFTVWKPRSAVLLVGVLCPSAGALTPQYFASSSPDRMSAQREIRVPIPDPEFSGFLSAIDSLRTISRGSEGSESESFPGMAAPAGGHRSSPQLCLEQVCHHSDAVM